MASEETYEARLTHVEQEVRLARSDAAAARVLAQRCDRDVESFGDKLAVQKTLIEAVRETQVTHGQTLTEHGHQLKSLTAEVREGFARQAVGQAQITALLDRIIDNKY
ncbi:phage-related baseplate assembly protein [Kibdelosporangium banguiense]|uniref:Phage-related baseplate assembly protein n=1 Tax=Kibdelosporangium banguiense TaxID=1365924 RepID=A0ABS4T7A3_9PSEU|nr:hypothetical protein [Kibdelosporangium banguiense]MBP2320287.1 phage-related baseplate assembly protein [Kibdelosporangium banguiense]